MNSKTFLFSFLLLGSSLEAADAPRLSRRSPRKNKQQKSPAGKKKSGSPRGRKTTVPNEENISPRTRRTLLQLPQPIRNLALRAAANSFTARLEQAEIDAERAKLTPKFLEKPVIGTKLITLVDTSAKNETPDLLESAWESACVVAGKFQRSLFSDDEQ